MRNLPPGQIHGDSLKRTFTPPMKNFIILLALFLATFGLYYFYVQSLATSLGLGKKALTKAEFIEGGAISLIASITIFAIAILVKKLRNIRRA